MDIEETCSARFLSLCSAAPTFLLTRPSMRTSTLTIANWAMQENTKKNEIWKRLRSQTEPENRGSLVITLAILAESVSRPMTPIDSFIRACMHGCEACLSSARPRVSPCVCPLICPSICLSISSTVPVCVSPFVRLHVCPCMLSQSMQPTDPLGSGHLCVRTCVRIHQSGHACACMFACVRGCVATWLRMRACVRACVGVGECAHHMRA